MFSKEDMKQCALILACTPFVFALLVIADAGISVADIQWALGYWFK
ncbi:putative TMhelix containing protein [Vibrio phage 150E35-1]|nr:putative TMhelix containing protein [Vibrio phage 150E35-1]